MNYTTVIGLKQTVKTRTFKGFLSFFPDEFLEKSVNECRLTGY